MIFFRETLVAIFAAFGMGTVLFLVLRRVFFPPDTLYGRVFFTIPVTEKTQALEETVREMQELCRTYGENARILLADAGMTEETKRLVRVLLREDDSILLADANEVGDVLTRIE